ncbi:MAG: hypothetical protein J4478_05000 [Candidatus Diapherotrites archaeon]|uniref:Uncharacterized protein n=1 Tax=Candidatus Iainarchaeum sp. TaxID=3101447 RepID=A0A7J4KT09_9ARCH|nr:hypothetical protein [Candidatus Diapherotrites archaeon]HIH33123.1 hypothetical protein [Candidatus Diapherotrites archaeon]
MPDSKNFQRKGSMAQYGLPKSRKCMNCLKDTVDDGTYVWLRGFCSDQCKQEYVEKLRSK